MPPSCSQAAPIDTALSGDRCDTLMLKEAVDGRGTRSKPLASEPVEIGIRTTDAASLGRRARWESAGNGTAARLRMGLPLRQVRSSAVRSVALGSG